MLSYVRDKLSNNFLVEKLRRIGNPSAGHNIPCDECRKRHEHASEASASETVRLASMYCVHYQMNFCGRCSSRHAMIGGSSGHFHVDIGKDPEFAGLLSRISLSTCDEHVNEEKKLFCQDCKVAICMICFDTSHKAHESSDIEEVSESLHSLVTDVDKLTEFIKTIEEPISRVEKEKKDVIKHLAGIEDEINTAADKLAVPAQRDRVKLLSEVESIRLKRVKQLETVKQELEEHLAKLKNLKRYSETLLNSGTSHNVTRLAKSLHEQADELMKFDVIGHVDGSLAPVNVTFTSSKLPDRDDTDRNLVGFLSLGQ